MNRYMQSMFFEKRKVKLTGRSFLSTFCTVLFYAFFMILAENQFSPDPIFLEATLKMYLTHYAFVDDNH